ncbi:MAG: hypothetical protein LLG01_14585 [Planctomycetaceae bacterium]|nr:hypothetical protein [Planctomycetaceae bacterium]
MSASLTQSQKRRWWQVALRVALAAAVVLVAAYVTLPYWLPAASLRNWLTSELSRQTGLKVTIGEGLQTPPGERPADDFRVTWRNDIEIRHLTFRESDRFGGGKMIFIDRVRVDFSPLDMLLRRRIEWMTLQGLEVNVRQDQEGNCNLAPLQGLQLDLATQHIRVQNATLRVTPSRSRQMLTMKISDMEYVAGKIQHVALGYVTVSALLEQEPSNAPVSLQYNGSAAPARTRFGFSNVELSQLNVAGLLNLPVRKLSGRCSGWVDLAFDADGETGQLPFEVDLSVENLDVQPLQGPHLPPVPQAGMSVKAVYHLNGLLDVLEGKVTLPGIDVRGKGSLMTRSGGEAIDGIDSLEISEGVVHPGRLAALLSGRSDALGDLVIAGPVRVGRLTLRHEGPRVRLAANLNATDAQVRYGGDVLKLGGRSALLDVEATLDQRTAAVDLELVRISVGGNSLIARGTLGDAGAAMEQIVREKGPVLRTALAHLTAMKLRGEWEIHDAEALLDLLGPRLRRQCQIDLEGSATGKWYLQPSADIGLHISADVPGGTLLTIGRRVAKPPGQALRLTMAAGFDLAKTACTNISMDVTMGPARLALDDGFVSLVADKDGKIAAGGKFSLTGTRTLLQCVPDRPEWLRVIDGDFTAACKVQIHPAAQQVQAQVALSQMNVYGHPTPGDQRTPGEKPWQLQGEMLLDAALTLKDASTLDMSLTCEAQKMSFDTGGPLPRCKPAAAPARLQFDGRLVRERGTAAVTVNTLHVTIGSSAVRLGGSAAFTEAEAPLAPIPARVDSYHLNLNAVCLLDRALLDLVPELKGPVAEHQISGSLETDITLADSGQGARLTARVDAGKLAVNSAALKVRKPAALPATAKIDAAFGADGRSFDLTTLELRLGALDVQAGATGVVVPTAGSALPRVTPKEVHLTASAPDVAALEGLVGDIRTYVPSGDFRLKLQWRDDNGGVLPRVELTTSGLGVRLGGKTVQVKGQMTAQNVRLTPGAAAPVSIEKLALAPLEISVEKNSLALVADLADLPDKPSGTFTLLAAAVDADELSRWVSPPASGAASRPASGPAALTAVEGGALLGRAQELIAQASPRLLACDISGRAEIDSLLMTDAGTGKPFHPRQVTVWVSLSRGLCKVNYAAALSGGTLAVNYAVHLADKTPLVSTQLSLKDAVATDTIQSLLKASFPGNTVEGTFSRTEDSTLPLRDLVASVLDSRYPLHPRGVAQTVAVDGIVRGRAAPMFVTRVFPGLNLTQYNYRRMTGFAELREDGSVVNDLVFDGSKYDLYMEGVTDASMVGRYQVGLILLGTPQSADFNHRYRQGRVPILKSKAQVVKGQMVDEEVTYPWPNESLFTMFLENNIFYRIWLNSKTKPAAPPAESDPHASK